MVCEFFASSAVQPATIIPPIPTRPHGTPPPCAGSADVSLAAGSVAAVVVACVVVVGRVLIVVMFRPSSIRS